MLAVVAVAGARLGGGAVVDAPLAVKLALVTVAAVLLAAGLAIWDVGLLVVAGALHTPSTTLPATLPVSSPGTERYRGR